MSQITTKSGQITLCLCLLFLFTSPLFAQPLSADDQIYTTEDVEVISDVLSNDQYSESGLPGSFNILVDAMHGSTIINIDGTVTYTPNPNYFGPDNYTYRICDLFNNCDDASVQIDVLPVNDAPLAGDDVDTTTEDTPVTTFVLENDDDSKDPGGVLLPSGVSITVMPSRGVVSLNPDGSIVYMPDPDYYGPDIYTYRVCDTGYPPPGLCEDATVLIHVLPVNDQPQAQNDTVFSWEDEMLLADVAANDLDPHDPYGGPDPSTLSLVSIPTHGTAFTDMTTGKINYQPGPDYNGNDSLLYRVCDLGYPLPSMCDTAWMFITVGPVNDPPAVVPDADQTDEDQAVNTAVLDNDSDTLDVLGGIDAGSVVITQPPLYGTATVKTDGKIRYQPNADFNGTDVYSYKVCDLGYGFPDMIRCDSTVVNMTVHPVNDAPVAVDDVAQGPHSTPLNVHLLDNDYDVDSDLDTDALILLNMPVNGSAGYDAVNKKVLFQPMPGWCGRDSVDYVLCDLEGACDTGKIYFDILCDMPQAFDDSLTLHENEAGFVAVMINDVSGSAALDPATLNITIQPEHLSSVWDPAAGVITVQPNAGWCGTDELTYSVCDMNNYCSSAVVGLNVLCDPFIVQDDVQETLGAVPVVIQILDNDDPGASPDCIELLSEPTGGTIDLHSDGSLRYYPFAGFSGEDCFEYAVCDTIGVVSGQAEVCVRVSPPVVSIPEVFTPNGDGINEELVIAGIEYYPYNKIMIFNRWENLVYENAAYLNDWKGTWQKNGQPLADGTYYVLIYLDTRLGDAKPVSAFTTIHR